ncbi:hypothetical protein C2S52_013075 [Perilla frutescens var. hirtella]|nr:hypothetical protein C2S52_013075 [Perilla frutescens var. hirtella]
MHRVKFRVRKMEATWTAIVSSMVVAASITCLVKLLNYIWFKPRNLEKFLREQGFNGNPYRPFAGDMKDHLKFLKQERTRSIQLSDNAAKHMLPYYHHIISKYGQKSFIWFGPSPRLNVTDPALIKEILWRPDVFEKPFPEKGRILMGGGLIFLEGDKWAKHRKIANHAFHVDKLKDMVPAIGLACANMINKLQGMVSGTEQGWCEIDIWPFLENLTGDVISRAAFGNSYEEGRRIFQLMRERVKLGMQLLEFSYLPGWRYLPTRLNREVKAITNEMQSILRGLISKRHKEMERGEETTKNDLLSILMEANSRFIQENGNKNAGMSIEDVIEECQLFYFAGSETTASLLVWTIVLLCRHPEWQAQAREEVVRVFGKSGPTSQGLNHLKIVTMILQEALRLYSPVPLSVRGPTKTVKLGNLTVPAGVHLTLLIGLMHYDPQIWGDDAKEFKPHRFSHGVSNATKIQPSFVPFSSGPRVCMGENFAMIEAKMALAMILQHFSFELSPSYIHAPFPILSLQPQFGAPIILRDLQTLSVS